MAGSASVGVRADGDDNVTAAGTFSRIANAPVQAGSTVIETFGALDLNASESMQGSLGYNPFNEVNVFIGEIAKKLGSGVGPRAAWERIKRTGDQIFLQSPS